MPDQSEPGRRGGASFKRLAAIQGARVVFARDGYTRASIDAIAKQASVSTRTIYNHFDDKKQLFLTMILDSAVEVRDAQIADIDRYLGRMVDLEADLHALGHAFAETPTRFKSHFALVRQINAEAEHLPVDVLNAWQETGPKAVHDELARQLKTLSERGLLTVADPDRAANQFVALVSTEVNNRSFGGALAIDPGLIDEVVVAGVQTFLRAYAPQPH